MTYHRNHNNWAHAQGDFVRTTKVETGLHEAFARLPKLQEVLMCSFYGPFLAGKEFYFDTCALKRMLRYTLLPPMMPTWGSSAHYCKTLISAAACVNVKLKTACFEAVEELFLDRATIEAPYVQSALSELKNLQIHFRLRGSSLNAAKIDNLKQLLSFMPMLRELH
jgi:hypothetical protein